MFPKTAQYETDWINKYSLAGNPLMGAESLTQIIQLTPEMRVLDLGCGTGLTSVFLQREFGVNVWAVDNGADLTKMYTLFKNEKVDKKAFPIRADARNLPFPEKYFDVIFAVNSYTYYGTDDRYLPYIARFLKPGGYLAVSDITVRNEIQTVAQIPECLKPYYSKCWCHVHTPAWWKAQWEKFQLFDVQCAETLTDSSVLKEGYITYAKAKQEYDEFAQSILKDKDDSIHFMRLIARRNDKPAYTEVYQNNVVVSK